MLLFRRLLVRGEEPHLVRKGLIMVTTVLQSGTTQYNLFTNFQTLIVEQGTLRETASA